MKKTLSILLCFILCSCMCVAQKITEGSIGCLKNEQKINMICNFDNCLIDKIPASLVKEKRQNWDEGVSEIISRFSLAVAKKSHLLISMGDFPDAKYTLIYYLSNIDDDQDCRGYMVLQETVTGTVVAKIEKANGSAGTYGSFFNLLGDAFEDLGEEIGQLIRRSN